MDNNGTNDSGKPTVKIPESVNEAYRRLVLDAPSLLPRCDMPVARLLFAEWFAEQKAQKDLTVMTHE
jgi:hypothetical protein